MFVCYASTYFCQVTDSREAGRGRGEEAGADGGGGEGEVGGDGGEAGNSQVR